MGNLKIDYSNRRVVDYNPLNCRVKDDSIVIFSPLSLIEGNNLFLPEKIRMPNGEITDKIIFEHWSFYQTLSMWQDGPITLYAGKNYAIHYFRWIMGIYNDSERDYALYYPNVNNIILYDDVIEFDVVREFNLKATDAIGVETVKISSKDGILYCDGNMAFVPDNNPYAESLPLEPMHGFYKEDFSDLKNFCLEGYGQDPFGGIYSLDGKRFIRYGGMTRRHTYRVRNGVEEIYDKAFCVHDLLLKTIELP